MGKPVRKVKNSFSQRTIKMGSGFLRDIEGKINNLNLQLVSINESENTSSSSSESEDFSQNFHSLLEKVLKGESSKEEERDLKELFQDRPQAEQVINELKSLDGSKQLKQVILEKVQAKERKRVKLLIEVKGVTKEILLYDKVKPSSSEYYKTESVEESNEGPKRASTFLVNIDTPRENRDFNIIKGAASKESKEKQTEFVFEPRKNKKALRKIFYDVENHSELYKIGDSYEKDFNNGIKNFAFPSNELLNAQARSILGLTSFFDHQSNHRVLIISHQGHENKLFRNVLRDTKVGFWDKLYNDKGLKYYSQGNFYFLNINDIEIFREGLDDREYSEAVESVLDKFDLVLWDLPGIEQQVQNRQLYYPLTMLIESVSIIVSLNKNSKPEIQKIIDFYSKYNVHIKGFLLDHADKKLTKKVSTSTT